MLPAKDILFAQVGPSIATVSYGEMLWMLGPRVPISPRTTNGGPGPEDTSPSHRTLSWPAIILRTD